MISINKIVKESGINLTGSVLGNLLGYVWLMIMTRTFSQDDVGSFTLAQSIVNISLIFVLLGTHKSLDRYIPLYNVAGEPGKIKSLLGLTFQVAFIGSLVVGSVVFLGADFLGRVVYDNPTLTSLLRIIIFSIPLLAVIMIVVYAFAGYKELRYHVYLKQFLEPALKIVFIILISILGLGIIEWTWFYLFALLITSGTGIIFLATRILHPLKDISREKISLSEIVGYSWPISISSILIIIIGQVDYLILGIYHPAAFVGIYRIYIQIAVLLQLLLSSPARIYKPVISELILEDDLTDIRDTYRRISKWVLSLTALGFLVILLYGARVIGLFFTEAYVVFPIALTILALGSLLKASFGPGGMTLEAFGNTKLILLNSVVMLLTNVGLGFILIPKYGIVGAAISTGATLAIGGLISFLEICFLYQMVPFTLATVKYIGIGAFTGIIFYGLGFWFNTDNTLVLFGSILVMIIIYVSGFFLTGSLDKVDRDALRKVIALISFR